MFQEYERQPLTVEAIQLQDDNLAAVANEIGWINFPDRIRNPSLRTEEAPVGAWVIMEAGTPALMSDDDFRATFIVPEEEQLTFGEANL